MTTTYPDSLAAARTDILNRIIDTCEVPAVCTAEKCEMIYDAAIPGNLELCDWHRHWPRQCTYNGCTTRQRELNHGLCREHAKGLVALTASRKARKNSTISMEAYYGVKDRPRRKTIDLRPRVISKEEYHRGLWIIEGMTEEERVKAGREYTPLFPDNHHFRTADKDPRRMCTIVWAILSGHYAIKNQ